jgi:H+-translocating NAD(P) transhydrogenase subunit alpha
MSAKSVVNEKSLFVSWLIALAPCILFHLLFNPAFKSPFAETQYVIMQEMHLVTLNETNDLEKRVALTPQAVQKLTKLGAVVHLPNALGTHLGFSDDDYAQASAQLFTEHEAALKQADVLVLVNKPSPETISRLKPGTILVSFLEPFRNPDLIKTLREHNISSICMELVPRTTYAQKMDALSSQASLAGYAAVIKAADVLPKILPMMSTPAGTIPPARVFIIGAGVAGLQAIATAKRLGARVEAYDTRPVVAEQVESLGAKFVKIDVGETGQTEQGYAKPLSEEQLELQRQGLAKVCANADIVITTAQVFGRTAPRLVTKDMVAGMKSGSVIVDLAASTGGNVEGTVPDQTVTVKGVKIIGLANLPGEVAKDASAMYANNVVNLIEHAWHKEKGGLELNLEDPVIKSVLLTHEGNIRDERIQKIVEG